MSFIGNLLNSPTSLAIASTDQAVIDGIGATNLVETFRFTTTVRSSVNLRLTGLTGNADLQLHSSGGVAATSVASGTSESDRF
jgi:hypothetical protein